MLITKNCRICGTGHTGNRVELQAHFYARADDSRKLMNTCRVCHGKATRKRTEAQREQRRAVLAASKNNPRSA